jgi:geranylgeranyl reductase family protein
MKAPALTSDFNSANHSPIVLGAGPGGVAAARALANAGISSRLLDRATFPRDKVCGDAISGKVVECLRTLAPEAVPQLEATHEALACWGIRFVAPNGLDLEVPFKLQYQPGQTPAPGFVAARMDFDHWLLHNVGQHPLIDLHEATDVTDIQPRAGGGWRLQTNQGPLETPLLIAADGAHSLAAKTLAAYRPQPRHYSAAIRAYYHNVAGLNHHNFIELHYLRSLLPGYLWVFPLPNGRVNVGLGMRSDHVSRTRANLKTLLQEAIQTVPELRSRFAHAELEGPVRGYGLPMGSRKFPISGAGYMLVGDAASLIDPFTGEGIGNAMFSGMVAAQVASAAWPSANLDTQTLSTYDQHVYQRLWPELRLSRTLQGLVQYPWLFNWLVGKARRSQELRETLICMFEDVNLRQRLSNPLFYLRVLSA